MPVNKQIRGDALLERIAIVIKKQRLEATKDGKTYVYKATSVSEEVPTIRVTLNKHNEFIQKTLNFLKADRRSSSGQALAEALRDKIDDLKDEIAEKDKIIAALRMHHIAIYEIASCEFNSWQRVNKAYIGGRIGRSWRMYFMWTI